MTDPKDPLDDALADWDPETSADPHTARVQTRRAVQHLRETGEYRRAGELKTALADETALTRRQWWIHHVRPGLHHLAEQGLIDHIQNYGYGWVGPDPPNTGP